MDRAVKTYKTLRGWLACREGVITMTRPEWKKAFAALDRLAKKKKKP
jgi:hypothetical protein